MSDMWLKYYYMRKQPGGNSDRFLESLDNQYNPFKSYMWTFDRGQKIKSLEKDFFVTPV